MRSFGGGSFIHVAMVSFFRENKTLIIFARDSISSKTIACLKFCRVCLLSNSEGNPRELLFTMSFL